MMARNPASVSSDKAASSSPQQRNPLRMIVGGVVVSVAIVLVVVVACKNRQQANDKPKKDDGTTASEVNTGDPVEGLRLYRMAQIANGFLENQNEVSGKDADGNLLIGYVEAEKRFVELLAALPKESLPLRNLAICRLLQLESAKLDELPADRRRQMLESTESIINQLKQSSSDAGLGYWLEARLQTVVKKNESSDEVVRAYENACQQSPDNPYFQVSLFEAARHSNAPQSRDRANQALGRAFQMLPTNLYLVTNQLLVLAQTQDESLAAKIEEQRPTISPLRKLILAGRTGTAYDIHGYLDNASQAAKDKQWRRAEQNIRRLQLLLTGTDAYKGDAQRIKAHPLEFMQQQFGPSFYQRYAIKTVSTDSQPRQVSFTAGKWPAFSIEGPVHDLRVVDVDLDQRADVVLLSSGRLQVFSLTADNKSWSLLTELALEGDFRGILAADLDRDLATDDETPGQPAEVECRLADVDFVVWGPDGIRVIRNQQAETGEGRQLVEVAQNESVTGIRDWTRAVLVDVDHDSDLDIVGCTKDGFRLLLHRGSQRHGTQSFDDYSQWIVAPDSLPEFDSMAIVDWDRDVDIDIFLGDSQSNTVGYLENLRHGRFRWQPLSGEFQSFQAGRALQVLESDGNVSWDLIGLNENNLAICQTTTARAGVVRHLATRTFGDTPYQGLMVADYDNDTVQDACLWSSGRLDVMYGAGDEGFEDAQPITTDSANEWVNGRAADLDGDGDMDLVMLTSSQLIALENQGGEQHHWLKIRTVGREDNHGRANYNGIGSLVEVKTGAGYQAQVVTSPETHFGLGGQSGPDVARIIWTNGMPQAIIQPQPRQSICEQMFLKGSCPFIYTWDGQRFQFVTDCLWAAPIGLQQAEGVLAPSRPWEYLKIPGELLKPRNDYYEIQVTEELWEAAYFDHIRLIAIDHPADVEIYSNEKVGPAEIAQFKIHTVQHRRLPVAARNQHGEDVLEEIRKRDDRYFRGFDQRIRQGLTPTHYLELDLGPLEQPQQLTLFLTGWIHPTDTSLNIAFSQDPEVDGPAMPSIWVPDAKGQWTQVKTPMGFPGGKTKTIAVDLSKAFLTDDYRLRIQTSAEIYWDEAFFTVDSPETPLRTYPMEVSHAELHYRGFSQRFPPRENTPERFDYQIVDTNPRWPPMRGNFTRYGDVTELLTATDDRMAILGSGDEMTVRFPVPNQAVPAGWQRDFFLYSVGWDKDADINTVHGQTVEPLPFQGMQQYPYEPLQSFPNTPQHLEYLRKYQQRQMSWPRFWRKLLGPMPLEYP